MKINCAWEHNGDSTLLYAIEQVGAYARGRSLTEALDKLPDEIGRYCQWLGQPAPASIEPAVCQEKVSSLTVSDADSDIILDCERLPLCEDEYRALKRLALRSAADFGALYQSIPDKTHSSLPARETFYGPVPRTAAEMYEHTKNVNAYYFGELGLEADNGGTILECRQRGFDMLEQTAGFLTAPPRVGSYDEIWSLRKVLRRFIWHDRIHARAMYRLARAAFPSAVLADPFFFGV